MLYLFMTLHISGEHASVSMRSVLDGGLLKHPKLFKLYALLTDVFLVYLLYKLSI